MSVTTKMLDSLGYTGCPCRECIGDAKVGRFSIVTMVFIVCSTCGNKRCPHATDHRHACTGSNEPGQAGSCYPKIDWSKPP